MKSIAFLQNKYYTDDGMQYVFRRLQEEFCKRDVELVAVTDTYASYPQTKPTFNAAVFWDKDIALGFALERAGVRLFNRAATVQICDDKEKTFAALDGKVELPPTVVAPLVYDISDGEDDRLLDKVEQALGYPVVVKECVGSLGRQVYLVQDRVALRMLHSKLQHTPHIYQQYIGGIKPMSDTRVYIVGGKAMGAVERENTTDFRSNVAVGGKMHRIELTSDLRKQAEQIANVLGLEYGSTDFIQTPERYVFIEANTSAYMQNAERLGIGLASLYASYITEIVYGNS